jgi:hypothetical protein
MVITMSDYLLEQEISTASCEDIVLEQYMAEADVYTAIANAYAKEVLMLEYASDAYLEEAEDGAKESKFKKFWSTIWEAIKRFFRFIGEKLAAFGRWVKSIFKGKPSEQLREDYEKMADEEAEEYLAKIIGNERDVLTDGKGRIQPHVYETAATQAWIENFDTWCDIAEKILEQITNNTKFLANGLVTKLLKELKTKSSALHNAEKKASGPKKSAKATLDTMAAFLKWYEDTGSAKMFDIRDKIQKMDSLLTSAKQGYEAIDTKDRPEAVSSYVACAKELRDEISKVSADVLSEISEKTEFIKKVEKAHKDFYAARDDLKKDARRRARAKDQEARDEADRAAHRDEKGVAQGSRGTDFGRDV